MEKHFIAAIFAAVLFNGCCACTQNRQSILMDTGEMPCGVKRPGGPPAAGFHPVTALCRLDAWIRAHAW